MIGSVWILICQNRDPRRQWLPLSQDAQRRNVAGGKPNLQVFAVGIPPCLLSRSADRVILSRLFQDHLPPALPNNSAAETMYLTYLYNSLRQKATRRARSQNIHEKHSCTCLHIHQSLPHLAKAQWQRKANY